MTDYVVPANSPSGITAFTLTAGQRAVVSVSGKWMTHPADGRLPYGAGGDGIPCSNCNYVRSPAGEGCLVWAIPRPHGVVGGVAAEGHWTRDDEVKTFTQPGQYVFAANDDNYGDNQGSLTLHVTIE
jgi:hypothetical protein